MSISFSLSNFKSFKKLDSIELKPLTLLCGINNSGKSSILQSLLLMKQSNFESSKLIGEQDAKNPLVFNGLYAKLGDWEDVIYRHAIEEEIGFSWTSLEEIYFYPTNSILEELEIDLFFWPIDYKKPIDLSETKKNKVKIDVKCKIKNAVNYDGKSDINLLIVSKFVFTNLDSGFSFELNNSSDGKYQLKLKKILLIEVLFRLIYEPEFYYYNIYFKKESQLIKKFYTTKNFQKEIINEVVFENIEVEFEGILPTVVKIDNFYKESKRTLDQIKQELKNNKKLSKFVFKFIDITSEKLEFNIEKSEEKKSPKKETVRENFLFLSQEKKLYIERYFEYKKTVQNLKKMWSSLRYIGPIREAPKRFYIFNDPTGIDIGINGENTALVLALEQDNQIPQYYRCIYQGKQIKEFELRDSDRMLDAVNWWLLECMKLPEIKSVVGLRGTINQVQLNSSGVEVSLPDVGFGVSQILPILVECLRVKEGETIILEQPEIHLHPSLQSKLADFFICMAKSGKNLVIETHSEHLINRLCLRVAQEESGEIQSLLNPLFVSFDEAEQTSVIKKITINEYGEIENWPVGFFDEDDSRELMEATLKKRMNQFKA